MPAKRAPMRNVREVLRLKHACGVSDHRIAKAVGIARSTVADCLGRAKVAGISWPIPDERLALLVDREAIERENKKLGSRLKFAGLRHTAVVEDTDMKVAHGLDKALFAKFAAGDWIARHQNLTIIGKTGLGKSWLACALGHKACRDDPPCSISAYHGCGLPPQKWRAFLIV